MIPVVTIDGPSGSGKGTISKALAIHLGWNYLDSGLIYRCFAYLTMIGTSDIPKAIKEIEHNFDLNKEEILFNGENITSAIRGTEVTMLSSELSQKPEVRSQLIEIQKTFREHPGLVAEGRDMSSKLFPDSLVKIYLTADLEERVNRRANQLRNDGQKVNISELKSEIEERDLRDTQREHSPLVKTDDSILIDNTGKEVKETLEFIEKLVNEKY
ncbi:MAG: (d)CMP kinase [Gammaproteobacteria bacterium]|jgi:cytidylate kinase|nr:cytidylate kinase [Gammaproteobacteria bacterium]MEC7167116.1 (d)CMP kinase [Pseudomonadota bacterium]MEC7805374.1 (d)CMP kinase [Pseudomonadota bacterium]GIR08241.1 MAG: cytidylate kinase [Gammaproteobacteria bacterium]|tara:strand:- start:436 stop:1077 length:642 start_codon:yes stop_codon:yes gene_type:complete